MDSACLQRQCNLNGVFQNFVKLTQNFETQYILVTQRLPFCNHVDTTAVPLCQRCLNLTKPNIQNNLGYKKEKKKT